MSWVAAAVAGYLIGSIPFAYVLTRALTGRDLRLTGSGNLGATNVLRHSGWGSGLAVLALDTGKGALAVWIGGWLGTRVALAPGAVEILGTDVAMVPAVVAGIGAVVGHVYPAWLGFAGGKGVATSAGAFAVLAPAATLGAAIAFVVIVWRTRYVSLGSVTAAALLPILALAIGEDAVVTWAALGVVALVAWRHRENIGRLRRGTERRLGERAVEATPAGVAATPRAGETRSRP